MASDLREHLVAYFEENHKLVEAGALRLLLDFPQPLVLSRDMVERSGIGSPFVTEAMVRAAIAERGLAAPGVTRVLPPAPVSSPVVPGTGAPDFSVVREGFAGAPPPGTPIEGYRRLFAARYRDLGRLLRGRSTLENPRAVRDLPSVDGTASIVGMVVKVRETSKNHHTILTLDDETGSVDVLVPKDSPLLKVPFVPDEVLGVKLRCSRERDRLPLLLGLERPDVAVTRNLGRSEKAHRAILLSDLHVGSRAFLSEEWSALVAFLAGQGPQPELARTIEYAVIAGDLVDGIGIYPRQEKDVAIADVFEQYAELGRRLRELPGRLTIVAVPGNHDAVSPAEPQPPLPPNLARSLPPNVRLLANPSTFALSGVTVTAYHGRGFDDLIPAIPHASYARPTEVMRRMLQMRHLAPIYGNRTPLAPAVRDGLVIDPVPDIFLTGHLHTYGVDRYRDVLLVNASTWQGETQYQRMRNITPAPARAAVVDLRTLETVTLDCSGGRPTLGGPAS